MTSDDIMRMAKVVGGYIPEQYPDELRIDTDDLVRFAALVAAAEREACANVCEELGYTKHGGWTCAEVIRARGQE